MVSENARSSTSRKKKSAVVTAPIAHGVGRRKNAVARIWLYRGSGKVNVNGQEVKSYFDTSETAATAIHLFNVHPMSSSYDAAVNVIGGGKVGQAGAVKLGIARAFLALDESLRPILRKYGMLTVDARQKERKKYGQRGARRKFQFVKR